VGWGGAEQERGWRRGASRRHPLAFQRLTRRRPSPAGQRPYVDPMVGQGAASRVDSSFPADVVLRRTDDAEAPAPGQRARGLRASGIRQAGASRSGADAAQLVWRTGHEPVVERGSGAVYGSEPSKRGTVRRSIRRRPPGWRSTWPTGVNPTRTIVPPNACPAAAGRPLPAHPRRACPLWRRPGTRGDAPGEPALLAAHLPEPRVPEGRDDT
jgi:hypothetical protein